MANLRLQGSTYHARLTIPADVRDQFENRCEFSLSTETGDLKLAKVRGAEIVAGWKRQIETARRGQNVSEWAKDWRKALKSANQHRFGEEECSEAEDIRLILHAELEDQVQRGRLNIDEASQIFEVAVGSRVILAHYREDYLKQYKHHALKTQAAYAAAVDRFLSRFSDNKQVTIKSLKQWLTHMAEEEMLSSKTIARMIGQAKSFWSYLIENEIIDRNEDHFTGSKMSVPKTAKKQVNVKPFSPEEVVKLLAAAKAKRDDQLALLITLGMYTGARIEELCMTKLSDFDADEGILSIRGTKTDAAEREVPLHPVLTKILQERQAKQSEPQEFFLQGLNIDRRGERGKALGKRFGRLKTELGFSSREKCFHSIRKTVGTLFEQAEVLEGVAADILGHEKQTMTYGLYSGGSSMKQKREAMNRLAYPASTA